MHLVRGMNGHPPQRPLEPLGVAIDHFPLPVRWLQAGKNVREHVCRVIELAGNVTGVLIGVAVVLDSLIPTHGIERRPIDPTSGQHSLALDEQHIAQMTAVLER